MPPPPEITEDLRPNSPKNDVAVVLDVRGSGAGRPRGHLVSAANDLLRALKQSRPDETFASDSAREIHI